MANNKPIQPAWNLFSCVAHRKLSPLSAPAVAVASHSEFVAVSDGRSGEVLLFYGLETDTVESFQLHVGSIVTAMCISSHSEPYLYTCSGGGIQRWILSWGKNESVLVEGGILPPEPVLNERLDGNPVYIDINKAGDSVIVCIDTYALVISTSSGRITARLEGHTSAVTGAAFRHDRDHGAVTISEDRRFIVYDLSSASVLYQSPIVSTSPFISLAMQEPPFGACLAIGSADGKARVYDLATPGCRLLQTIDVPAITGAQ